MASAREQAFALIQASEAVLRAPVKADPPGATTVKLAKQILAAAKAESIDRMLQSCDLEAAVPGWTDILAVMQAVIAATKP